MVAVGMWESRSDFHGRIFLETSIRFAFSHRHYPRGIAPCPYSLVQFNNGEFRPQIPCAAGQFPVCHSVAYQRRMRFRLPFGLVTICDTAYGRWKFRQG